MTGFTLAQDIVFPGAALDSTRWCPYNGGQFASANISVTAGELHLVTSSTQGAGCKTFESQTCGRWEVTARMDTDPAGANADTVPCLLLWPASEKWPDDIEIDFMEAQRAQRDTTIFSAHYKGAVESGGSTTEAVVTGAYFWQSPPAYSATHNAVAWDGTKEHVYAVEWTPTSIAAFIDGQPAGVISDPACVPTTAHYLGMQIAPVNTTPPTAGVGLHIAQVKTYTWS